MSYGAPFKVLVVSLGYRVVQAWNHRFRILLAFHLLTDTKRIKSGLRKVIRHFLTRRLISDNCGLK